MVDYCYHSVIFIILSACQLVFHIFVVRVEYEKKISDKFCCLLSLLQVLYFKYWILDYQLLHGEALSRHDEER